jgi:hypothetical protein
MGGIMNYWENHRDESRKEEALRLEMLHVAFHKQLPDCLPLEERSRFRMTEQAVGGIVASLSTWLLDGHRSDIRTEYDTIEYPSSPWQHLKQQYAPQWALKRWPVRMEEKQIRVSVHHHFVCPHASPKDKYPNDHMNWMGIMSGQLKEDGTWNL